MLYLTQLSLTRNVAFELDADRAHARSIAASSSKKWRFRASRPPRTADHSTCSEAEALDGGPAPEVLA